jgi:major intracellular serine protease
MYKVKLIPYQIDEVYSSANEIPPGVQMIHAPKFWDKTGNKGDGVVIAVLDTGCQADHPDLKGQIIEGVNFTDDDQGDPHNISDGNGHGTHVAGTIAAVENGKGVIGVAPKAKLLILKVLNSQGQGTYQSITNAIHYAIDWRGKNDERVRVISMSLGGPVYDYQMHMAIRRATESGIVVICAAGNEGKQEDNWDETIEIAYPGALPEVIQVGAVDLNQKIAYFSNTNDQIDSVAPGVQIISTIPDNKYARFSGTSMATPHVAGAAALILSQGEKEFRRKFNEAEIYSQICKHTIPLGNSKWAEGNGLLDLAYLERVNC